MRPRRFRRGVMLGVLVGLLAVAASPSGADPLLKITPAMSVVDSGDGVTLNVEIENVIDLWAYDVRVVFDPAVVVFEQERPGPFLSLGASTYEFALVDTGWVRGVGTRLGQVGGVSGSGVLFYVDFRAGHIGTGAIAFGPVGLLDSSSGTIEVTGQTSGQVTVVPEPGTLALLGLGLFGVLRRIRGR